MKHIKINNCLMRLKKHLNRKYSQTFMTDGESFIGFSLGGSTLRHYDLLRKQIWKRVKDTIEGNTPLDMYQRRWAGKRRV